MQSAVATLKKSNSEAPDYDQEFLYTSRQNTARWRPVNALDPGALIQAREKTAAWQGKSRLRYPESVFQDSCADG